MKKIQIILTLILFININSTVISKPKKKKTVESTFIDVAYGKESQQKLDFWKAPGKGPRPVIIYIHGGGWINGDKRSASKSEIQKYAKLGISYAAVNYRHTPKHPLPAPVHDAARAVQFIRSKAKEWNINKNRIGLTGGSAGACTSMWILLHDDLKNKKSKDPVLRESSRVSCAVIGAGQTSIDPKVIEGWIGPSVLKHAMIFKSVGGKSMKEVLANYKKYAKLYKEFSPINHLDKNDPPLFMKYSSDGPANSAGKAIHHYKFGLKMKEASDKVGHECYLSSKSFTKKQKYKWDIEFFKAILLK